MTYSFTEAEKNTILNGGNVSVSGKSSVTPLEGTFASVMSVDNCTMQISDYYTWCSAGKHNNGEICDAEEKSQHIVTMTMVCQGGLSPQPGIEEPGDGGSGEGGGTSPNPCSVNGVYLQPQDPASSGCNAGVVTLPNIEAPNFSTPCGRVKALVSQQHFKDNLESLRDYFHLNSERGYRMDYPNGNNNINQFLQSKPNTNLLDYSYSLLYTYAILHTHFDSMHDPMLSPGDLIQFNDWLVKAKVWNDNPANLQKVNLKNISYTLVTSEGSYMLTFDGTNVTPFSGYDIDKLNEDYEKEVLQPATTVGNMSGQVNYNMDKMEENFLKFAKQYLPIPGMKLFRIADGLVNTDNREIFLDNTNSRDTITCN